MIEVKLYPKKMPNTLSKFFAGHLKANILHAHCGEYAHVWNGNCWLAIVDAIPDGLLFSVKTFGSLYLVSFSLFG